MWLRAAAHFITAAAQGRRCTAGVCRAVFDAVGTKIHLHDA